jgi:hypothetical protein
MNEEIDEEILTNEEMKRLKHNRRILKRYHERMETEPNFAEKMREKARARNLKKRTLAILNGEVKEPKQRGFKIKYRTVEVVQKIEMI